VPFHRNPPEVRGQQIRRIMREARERYGLDTMVDEYVKVYERLTGRPLN
jgi:hypothetical protein